MKDKITAFCFIIVFLLIVSIILSATRMARPATPEEIRAGVDKCESLDLGYYQGGFGDVFCKVK